MSNKRSWRWVDLTGQRFGLLLVRSFAGINDEGISTWLCLCDCGQEKIIRGKHLKNGSVKSCGHLQTTHAITHGLTRGARQPATYSVWRDMRQRCENPNNVNYDNYGGRGIAVCERWHSFENFLADMGEKPARLTIDRIDNDKGYAPDNCRWATAFQQNNNKRPRRWAKKPTSTRRAEMNLR